VQDEISSRLKLEVHLSHADILGVVSACKLVGNVQGRLEERVKKFLYQVGAKMDQVAVGGIKLKPQRASMVMDFRTFAGNASVPAASWQPHSSCRRETASENLDELARILLLSSSVVI
jgi:hypothetical protein